MDQTVTTAAFPFDNSYARLPDRFFARVSPTPVRAPRLIRLNRALAAELGLDPDRLATAESVEALAGNRIPEGAEPIAQAYAGHQFGGWVPQLGDGRAILLGEVVDHGGRRRDIQLKGSGRTPFSRMGDGRAPLGPVLREYIVSEAMAKLGVPTTRALAAVATGEEVVRERVEPGAVLTRVAASHIRVGTFQFFAAREDADALRRLADHVIARHYPEAAGAEVPYLALLERVIARQARLVAQWLGIGFIHGVMNTDNMAVSGETIDYGPCAFMDSFHPAKVFSSIDRGGRYAYGNQPRIAQWNLAQLAQSLLPLLPGSRPGSSEEAIAAAQAAIDRYPDLWLDAWLDVMRAKLGLATRQDGDQALIEDLLARMAANEADFTLTFRGLAALADPDAPAGADDGPRALFADPAAFDGWAGEWRRRLSAEETASATRAAALRAANPLFIPRNHLVEEAIAAAEGGDFSPFETLLEVLSAPFDDQPRFVRYAEPPRPEQLVHRTFCGT
jgi:serine/tyrosine/threonine adenylyltransferase